ncbi:MAG: peptide-methionine (S)-S-oxide reductase MsrA [Candidatus Sericytochromatia bacterium]|nr:peptide-methionine (S)-S-oxide reductase MsrA [Candidatus Sericytochromatia bacterium]
MNPGQALATFGGGCFWCTEAIFLQLTGVESVQSGYAGGTEPEPSYEAVCQGRTGHAEVVQVRYDPAIISYDTLLQVFFATHDPTTPDRQGADVGSQYRSVVLVHDDAQRAVAEQVVRRLEADQIFDAPIVTQIQALTRFWPAEAYHQNYLARNPAQPYCQAVVSPKVAKFRHRFQALLRP